MKKSEILDEIIKDLGKRLEELNKEGEELEKSLLKENDKEERENIMGLMKGLAIAKHLVLYNLRTYYKNTESCTTEAKK